MFRAAGIRRAPLATLKPVLAVSISSQNTVRRIIGIQSNRGQNASAINAVVEKTKGDGLAGNAAAVARAFMYVEAQNPISAVEEIDSILPKIEDEALRRMAVGVRLRARNRLLDLKETALSVSGGATEAEVSDIRTKVKEDYNALKASSPGCWLVQLAAAEYDLYTGSVEEAYESFVDIEEKIASFINTPVQLADDVASPQNTNPFSLLGFELQRSYNTMLVRPKVAPIISEAIGAIATEPKANKGIAAVKAQLGANLTDEETIEIAFTMQSAYVRHHFHDFFPRPAEYADWNSPASQQSIRLLRNIFSASYLTDEQVEEVRASVPPSSFYGSQEKLLEVLRSAPKDQSVVASVRKAFGPGPQSPLCAADEAFYNALNSLKAAGASQDTAGTTAYAKRQMDVAKILAHQLLYRTQVQIGVALTEMNRLHDAVEVITPVVTANEYIYMWRAFLARSRAYKGLGLITNADKDAKILKELKKSLTDHAPYEML